MEMSSLHQTNLSLSPSAESDGSDGHGSPTVIPCTPLKEWSGSTSGSYVGRRLFSSNASSGEMENLANVMPRWCQNSSYRDPSPTPSVLSSTTTSSGRSLPRSGSVRIPSSASPGSSASTSDCKLLQYSMTNPTSKFRRPVLCEVKG